MALAEHTKVIETDLLGTLCGSYYAYRRFLAQGPGTLINMSSELGKHTVPYYTSYAAAKHEVVGLCESLRQEIEQNEIRGINVCLVMPTAHDTPFFDHVENYTGHETQAPKARLERALNLAHRSMISPILGEFPPGARSWPPS